MPRSKKTADTAASARWSGKSAAGSPCHCCCSLVGRGAVQGSTANEVAPVGPILSGAIRSVRLSARCLVRPSPTQPPCALQEPRWSVVAPNAEGDGCILPGAGQKDHTSRAVWHCPWDYLHQSSFRVYPSLVCGEKRNTNSPARTIGLQRSIRTGWQRRVCAIMTASDPQRVIAKSRIHFGVGLEPPHASE